MPIKDVQENAGLKILGKIRLGERVVSQKGSKYPKTVPYFVLKDAPEVAKVKEYGEKPTSLDILFPDDDPQKFMPYWYKWYAGSVKNRDGDYVGGRLQCYGDGEEAHHIAERDRVTRVVPTRKCLVRECPDWVDAKGNQQCKQSMSVFVLLPLVSWFGVYQIDTTSWASIHSFVDQVNWIKNMNQGVIRMLPLKISREETQTNYTDPSGKDKSGIQYIMKLSPNEEFAATHGQHMQAKIEHAFNVVGQYKLPSEQNLIERPMEDHFESKEAETPDVPQITVAQQVAEAEWLAPYFKELCELTNKNNSKKMRFLTTKKFEDVSTGEVDKDKLKTYLADRVAAEKAKVNVTPEQPASLI